MNEETENEPILSISNGNTRVQVNHIEKNSNPSRKRRKVKKSCKHRKRHILPGPAGELFQLQLQAQQQRKDQERNNNNNNSNIIEIDESKKTYDNKLNSLTQQDLNNAANITQPANSSNNEDQTNNLNGDFQNMPAWKTMCCSLDRYLPPLSSFFPLPKNPKKYYSLLKKNLSSNYMLIHELTNHTSIPSDKFLVVSLVNVYCHAHCDWTCDIRDESTLFTKTKISAWLENRFCKANSHVITPGTVLLLNNASFIVSKTSNSQGKDKIERFILIGNETVITWWTNEDAVVFWDKEQEKFLAKKRKEVLKTCRNCLESQEEEEEEVLLTQSQNTLKNSVTKVDQDDLIQQENIDEEESISPEGQPDSNSYQESQVSTSAQNHPLSKQSTEVDLSPLIPDEADCNRSEKNSNEKHCMSLKGQADPNLCSEVNPLTKLNSLPKQLTEVDLTPPIPDRKDDKVSEEKNNHVTPVAALQLSSHLNNTTQKHTAFNQLQNKRKTSFVTPIVLQNPNKNPYVQNTRKLTAQTKSFPSQNNLNANHVTPGLQSSLKKLLIEKNNVTSKIHPQSIARNHSQSAHQQQHLSLSQQPIPAKNLLMILNQEQSDFQNHKKTSQPCSSERVSELSTKHPLNKLKKAEDSLSHMKTAKNLLNSLIQTNNKDQTLSNEDVLSKQNLANKQYSQSKQNLLLNNDPSIQDKSNVVHIQKSQKSQELSQKNNYSSLSCSILDSSSSIAQKQTPKSTFVVKSQNDNNKNTEKKSHTNNKTKPNKSRWSAFVEESSDDDDNDEDILAIAAFGDSLLSNKNNLSLKNSQTKTSIFSNLNNLELNEFMEDD